MEELFNKYFFIKLTSEKERVSIYIPITRAAPSPAPSILNKQIYIPITRAAPTPAPSILNKQIYIPITRAAPTPAPSILLILSYQYLITYNLVLKQFDLLFKVKSNNLIIK